MRYTTLYFMTSGQYHTVGCCDHVEMIRRLVKSIGITSSYLTTRLHGRQHHNLHGSLFLLQPPMIGC